MLFTVGHQNNYDECFREAAPEIPMKKGKTVDYEGGSVWQTYEEAEQWCLPGFIVYGVMADWDTETVECDEPWHELLVDAPLVQLNRGCNSDNR